MKTVAGFFGRLTRIEQSFQIEGPWQGRFELDGHNVGCALSSDEWLRLSVPLAGRATEFVRQQGRLRLPVKIISGPTLIAEMPSGDDLDSTFAILHAALRQGLAFLEAGPEGAASAESRETDVNAPLLESLLAETVFDWTRADGHLSAGIEAAKVVAEADDVSAAFRTDIAVLGPATDSSLCALADFVLAMNGRLRFARGTFATDTLVLESVLPMVALTPILVDCIVGAMATTLRMAKPACRALLNGHVAEQYLEFHGAAGPQPDERLIRGSRLSKTERKVAHADSQH